MYSRTPSLQMPLAPTTSVPAGAEGFAPLALADALKERAQQTLGLGMQVQAVGHGGVALGPAINARVSFAMEQGGSLAPPS